MPLSLVLERILKVRQSHRRRKPDWVSLCRGASVLGLGELACRSTEHPNCRDHAWRVLAPPERRSRRILHNVIALGHTPPQHGRRRTAFCGVASEAVRSLTPGPHLLDRLVCRLSKSFLKGHPPRTPPRPKESRTEGLTLKENPTERGRLRTF